MMSTKPSSTIRRSGERLVVFEFTDRAPTFAPPAPPTCDEVTFDDSTTTQKSYSGSELTAGDNNVAYTPKTISLPSISQPGQMINANSSSLKNNYLNNLTYSTANESSLA